MSVTVPVSWGELIDKITILEIKAERIAEAGKLANIRKELGLLNGVKDQTPAPAELAALQSELKAVNIRIWENEDHLRDWERRKAYGPEFVDCARSAYINNDLRSHLKRRVNELMDSDIVEEKSYAPY